MTVTARAGTKGGAKRRKPAGRGGKKPTARRAKPRPQPADPAAAESAATEIPPQAGGDAPPQPGPGASETTAQRRTAAAEWDAKGRQARARGEYQTAYDCFQRALALDPERADTYNNLGNVFLAVRNMEAAEHNYRIALRLNPDLAVAWQNIGYVRMYQDRDLKGATEFLARSLALDPGNADANYLLGLALRRMGRPGEALAPLARSMATGDPGRALYQTGVAELQLGHPERALEILKQARAHLPRDPYVEIEIASIEAAARHPNLPPDAKRVAVHINQRFHYPIVARLFRALSERHRTIFTSDAQRMREFDPDVVIVADAQSEMLRLTMPRAIFVHVRHGLSSKNSICVAARVADYACVTSEAAKAWYLENGGAPRKEIWVTGYVQADPLFHEDAPRLPFTIPPGRKTVVYAPTYNYFLSSVPMLGPRTVELIRGERKDIAIIIKPHPHICSMREAWLDWWRAAAAREPDVFLVEDPAANLVPYLKAADLLVTDVSSAAFMYLALDRPIVLVTNPDATKDRERYDPKGPEWTWRDMGEEVHETGDLAAAVARGLDDPAARHERRAHYRALLFGDLTDGRAAERIVAHVTALPARR